MRRLFLTVALCLLGAAEATPQAPHTGDSLGKRHTCSCCPNLPCCPDDYCKKSCTIFPGPCGGGCDDYCRKPMPCIIDINRCGGCDDYCLKPVPSLLCPSW